MSKSGNEFIARTEGTQFTLYSAMKMLGIPLTEEQEKFQKYLEGKYPVVVKKNEKKNMGGGICQT